MTEITNQNENLLRQIAKYHLDSGRLSHKVFKPKTTDASKLSVSLESGISPRAAFDHFTGVIGASSCGVAKLKVHEVTANELSVNHDPLDPQDNLFNINHALIDFTNCPDHNKTAKTFLKLAEDQGRIMYFDAANEVTAVQAPQATVNQNQPTPDN